MFTTRTLLSGNEAIALGAFKAGCTAAFGYPGTPSTEILENFVQYRDRGVYCEWSVNEKVALEAAAGAAMAGVRSMVTMKLVGLNVAADPLMTLSYSGVVGGMVVVVADDPGQHSSQTEQDTRHYARLAKVPVLEPADAQDAHDFMLAAFELSEAHSCPVILRTTTCVSHSRRIVASGERRAPAAAHFVKDNPRFIPLPVWGRRHRRDVEARMVAQAEAAATSPLNTTLRRGRSLGIVSHGITALICEELFPRASVLRIGWGWPFPDRLLTDFANSVEHLLVVEEGDPILEEHIRALGHKCLGKELVPRCGELTPAVIAEVRAKLLALVPAAFADGAAQPAFAPVPKPVAEAADLPARPPVFCPGCPHRALFYALTKFDVIVCGDIGCYSLGAFPPLDRTDTMVCMGAGFTVAHGMDRAGERAKPIVGLLGDSTFFHSGMTGLLDVVYNRGATTLIVLDNRITAMTGHQDHPGTGRTLMGEPTNATSIEAVAQACGIAPEHIRVCDPYDWKGTAAVLKEEMAFGGPSLVVSRAPCPLHLRHRLGPSRSIDTGKCKSCKACLKCGCPALELYVGQRQPRINPTMCIGCSLCERICPFGAIS